MADPLVVARAQNDIVLLPRMANRHGLIAGATGTGKTVSLRVLAERFSHIGVPVFMADAKGDLSGMARPGADDPKLQARARQMGINLTFDNCPVVFWDVYGAKGHPVRVTISDMGPLLRTRTEDGLAPVLGAMTDDGRYGSACRDTSWV